MGNTTIPTQSLPRHGERAELRATLFLSLCCAPSFLWAVANNLNDILLPQFQQAFTLTNFRPD